MCINTGFEISVMLRESNFLATSGRIARVHATRGHPPVTLPRSSRHTFGDHVHDGLNFPFVRRAVTQTDLTLSPAPPPWSSMPTPPDPTKALCGRPPPRLSWMAARTRSNLSISGVCRAAAAKAMFSWPPPAVSSITSFSSSLLGSETWIWIWIQNILYLYIYMYIYRCALLQ